MSNIIVKSDSQVVIWAKSVLILIRNLVRDIRYLANNIKIIRFYYYNRTTNKLADKIVYNVPFFNTSRGLDRIYFIIFLQRIIYIKKLSFLLEYTTPLATDTIFSIGRLR